MKRLLVLMFALAAASSAVAQEVVSNGGMPDSFPPLVMVARVPMGSGVPSPGLTAGYSEATPVSDGLYHVPGYLPLQSTAAEIWPRVINVKCRFMSNEWYCTGYHVDGVLERGEDVYVRPIFEKSVKLVEPVLPALRLEPLAPLAPVARAVTPVPHVHHVVKSQPKICK
jgi:hypothetical protein